MLVVTYAASRLFVLLQVAEKYLSDGAIEITLDKGKVTPQVLRKLEAACMTLQASRPRKEEMTIVWKEGGKIRPYQQDEVWETLFRYWLARLPVEKKQATATPDLFMSISGYSDSEESIASVSNQTLFDYLNPHSPTQPQDFLIESSEEEMEKRKKQILAGSKDHRHAFPKARSTGQWYKRKGYYLLARNVQQHIKLFWESREVVEVAFYQSGTCIERIYLPACTLASAQRQAAELLRKKYASEIEVYSKKR